MDGLWDHGVDMVTSEERMPSYTAVCIENAACCVTKVTVAF